MKCECPNCNKEVLPHTLYQDTDSRVWKCTECKALIHEEFKIVKLVKKIIKKTDPTYLGIRTGVNVMRRVQANSIYGKFVTPPKPVGGTFKIPKPFKAPPYALDINTLHPFGQLFGDKDSIYKPKETKEQ